MMDSDEECDDRFYCDREEFSDVTPIPQDDGPFPVVSIDYYKSCTYICLFQLFLAKFVKS